MRRKRRVEPDNFDIQKMRKTFTLIFKNHLHKVMPCTQFCKHNESDKMVNIKSIHINLPTKIKNFKMHQLL